MAITFQNIMDFATVNRQNYEQLKQQIQPGYTHAESPAPTKGITVPR